MPIKKLIDNNLIYGKSKLIIKYQKLMRKINKSMLNWS